MVPKLIFLLPTAGWSSFSLILLALVTPKIFFKKVGHLSLLQKIRVSTWEPQTMKRINWPGSKNSYLRCYHPGYVLTLECHQDTFRANLVTLLFLKCPTFVYQLWLNLSLWLSSAAKLLHRFVVHYNITVIYRCLFVAPGSRRILGETKSGPRGMFLIFVENWWRQPRNLKQTRGRRMFLRDFDAAWILRNKNFFEKTFAFLELT